MNRNKQYLISSSVIIRAKEGDEQAFEEIYNAYSQRVNFMVNQFILDEEEAKDITHDIFINIYKNIGTLKEPKAFHAWLYCTTYNTCSNFNRTKFREVVFHNNNDAEEVIDSSSKETLDIIENQRIIKIVETTLQEMDETLKSVGMLKYFSGLKISEIEQVLDIPKGTVKSRLNRVRSILKDELRKQGVSPKVYGFTFLLPQVISQVYESMFVQTTEGIVISEVIIKKSLVETATALIAMNAKVIGGIALVVTSAYVGISMLPEEEPVVKPVVQEVIEQPEVAEVEAPSISPAQINTINYSQEWTNESIVIEVVTSNEEFDAILIDGVLTNQIDNNGTYQVQLQRNGEIIDSRELIITNIDRNSPQMTSEHDGNSFTIYLSDDISGINPNTIRFLREGVQSSEYQYDAANQIIKVQTKKEYSDIFYVYDYAGNELRLVFD